MRYFFTLLSFCIFVPFAHAQQDRVISITAEGDTEIPADIIQFNINLNAEADSPQRAYDLHKQRENVLVQLLNQYEISEDDIRFQPVSIQKGYSNETISGPNRERQVVYRTNQQVSLTLKDFDTYEKIQLTLIKNNFDQFSGNFLSSKQQEGENEALRQAVQKAREKAEIIAQEENLTLHGIKSISYHENQPVLRPMASFAMQSTDSRELMDYDQTVVVRVSVSIDYFFE